MQSHRNPRELAVNERFSVRATPPFFALSLALAIAIAQLGPRAHAQDAHDRAVALLDQSAEHYREGRFAEAAELLREAYQIEAAPVLLYNLARALESLGDLRGAVDAYEGYIEGDPNAEDRGAIEARLETLRRQIAALERVEAADAARRAIEPRQPAVVDEELASGASPAAWIVAGGGGAGLIVGAVLGVLAQLRHDDAIAAKIQTERVALADEADDLAAAANVAFAVGGTLLFAGLVWGVIDLALE